METMNGQPIYLSKDDSTLFIPIPREIAADVAGGCQCEYCRAHSDITPKWDTLALAAKPKNKGGEHTWTVHFPDLDKAGLRMFGWRKP